MCSSLELAHIYRRESPGAIAMAALLIPILPSSPAAQLETHLYRMREKIYRNPLQFVAFE